MIPNPLYPVKYLSASFNTLITICALDVSFSYVKYSPCLTGQVLFDIDKPAPLNCSAKRYKRLLSRSSAMSNNSIPILIAFFQISRFSNLNEYFLILPALRSKLTLNNIGLLLHEFQFFFSDVFIKLIVNHIHSLKHIALIALRLPALKPPLEPKLSAHSRLSHWILC